MLLDSSSEAMSHQSGDKHVIFLEQKYHVLSQLIVIYAKE